MDMQTDPLEAFRREARGWIDTNLPPSLRADPDAVTEALMGGAEPREDVVLWRERLADRGWGVPTWPTEWGGGGLDRPHAQILAQEMTRSGARNPIGGMGVGMFGPTLLEYGDEEQKTKHMPGIVRGTVRWCQGFSEPGAGSDLASLQTKAEDRGDHFLVNGQKIWTSGGQYADWCFCLVRTDPKNKHEGISFLLIDMRSPGVEVRPIVLISGSSPFCETFFTDVKVPKENLMGGLNRGWAIAKRLLQHERNGMGTRSSAAAGQEPLRVEDMAKTHVGVDGQGRIADPDLRARIIRHLMEAVTLRQTVQRQAAEAKAGQGPSATTSIMKNVSMKVAQDRLELLIEVMGVDGLGWMGEGFSPDGLEITRNWLASKAFTIYGGSTEIQNNIIAKRILGLLDHQ